MQKRLIDIIISFISLLVFMPLILSIAVLILISMGRPILFRQQRVGYNNQIFTIYKFCTMKNKRDANNHLLPDHTRLTSLGKLLRRFSLDELPQLWNVLKGDMSLVGPRPLPINYLPRYNAFQKRRHEIKPGITGMSQVNGRNAIDWNEKFKLDVWYVDHQTFWLDLQILFLTIIKVIKCDGISQSEKVTMPEFLGNHE